MKHIKARSDEFNFEKYYIDQIKIISNGDKLESDDINNEVFLNISIMRRILLKVFTVIV